MRELMDDVSGAVLDVLKLILSFILVVVLVGTPLYVIAKVFEWLY